MFGFADIALGYKDLNYMKNRYSKISGVLLLLLLLF